MLSDSWNLSIKLTVAVMGTYSVYQDRFDFIEALSLEFVMRTGCGIYVYLNPEEVNDLFIEFQNRGLSIRAFARQILKNVLR